MQKIGEDQAHRVSESLRREWSGLSTETKGKVLTKWGEWADDPKALAQGVTDLAQGKLQRYGGAAGLKASDKLSAAASTLNDQAAENARTALADIFADKAA